MSSLLLSPMAGDSKKAPPFPAGGGRHDARIDTCLWSPMVGPLVFDPRISTVACRQDYNEGSLHINVGRIPSARFGRLHPQRSSDEAQSTSIAKAIDKPLEPGIPPFDWYAGRGHFIVTNHVVRTCSSFLWAGV